MASSDRAAITVTALTASAQLGGTERVLLDFATHAFEYDIVLRVITPRHGPLVDILNEIGVPANVVKGPEIMLRGSQRGRHLASVPGALVGLVWWARRLARHPWMRDADFIYSVAFKAHVAAAGQRAPNVWHLHEFPPALTGGLWKRLARRTPVALIANSRAVAEAWGAGNAAATGRRQRITPPITVVPNGVELDRFRPTERIGWMHRRLEIPDEHRLVGMPAVLAKWKGQLEVIAAFERVAPNIPDVDLVFVGGTIYDTVSERDFERTLRAAIQSTNARIGKRIHLMPFQAKIERVYPELDLALHYSTRPEAFGRVILEAMACGVPVIAANEGGPVEIVEDGGWLVEPRNPAALADRLVEALRLSRDALAAVGQAGRRRAEDHYSARGFARGVSRVLKQVHGAGRTVQGADGGHAGGR